MEPCVLIASSCDSISPQKIVQGILEKDDLPEPLQVVDGIFSYPWHIDTKYYEADVHVCAMHEKTIGNQTFADSVNAVILCFDSLSESKLEPVEQWLSFTKEFDADIKILICDTCHADNDFSNSTKSTKSGVSKLEAQRWCVKNGFELVELNPDQSEVDSDVEDDFPESLGIKRVIQALHAHIWPKLRLKDSHKSMLPPQAGLHLQGLVNNISSSSETVPNNNFTESANKESRSTPESMMEALDSMSDDTFEQLFLNLNAMKSKASNMTPTERKVYAEKLALQFLKAVGDEDEENDDDSNL